MRLFKYLILFYVLLFVTSCKNETIKIGILIYDQTDTFISELEQNLIRNLPSDVKYEIKYAANSQFLQNQQLLELLDSNVDILLINAVDRLASASIVEKCNKKNVPIIFFNREPLEEDLENSNNVYYVGADADSLGIKQADIVSELFGLPSSMQAKYDKNGDNTIQTVIIKGEQGHQDAEKRTSNCIARLQSLGYSVDLLSTRVANWRRSEGYLVMKEMYEEFNINIELVFANNDDMALGAIDYLLEENIFTIHDGQYDQPLVIIGVDGTQVGLNAIEQGLMYGSVLNDAKKQSQVIVDLVEYLKDKKDMITFPYNIENQHYVYVDGEAILKAN